jgi:hypothetical protein
MESQKGVLFYGTAGDVFGGLAIRKNNEPTPDSIASIVNPMR